VFWAGPGQERSTTQHNARCGSGNMLVQMLCPNRHRDNNTALMARPTALSTLPSTYQPPCRIASSSSPPPRCGMTLPVLTGGQSKCLSNTRWWPSSCHIEALSLWGSARAAPSPRTPVCSSRRGGEAWGHRCHERVPPPILRLCHITGT
jgi:hypothetical protein